MPKSDLPQATFPSSPIKFGPITVQPQEPTQTAEEAIKSLESLEKAAEEGAFKQDEPTE